MSNMYISKWQKDFYKFLSYNKSLITFSGNIHDTYVVNDKGLFSSSNLPNLIIDALIPKCKIIKVYDLISKIQIIKDGNNNETKKEKKKSDLNDPSILKELKTDKNATVLDEVNNILSDYIDNDSIGYIIDFSDKIFLLANRTAEENKVFIILEKIIQNLNNNKFLVLIFSNSRLIPAEIRQNPKSAHIDINIPSRMDTKALCKKIYNLTDEFQIDEVVNATEGLYMDEIINLLDRNKNFDLKTFQKDAQEFKFGTFENPYDSLSYEKLLKLDSFLNSYIKGQEHVIKKMCESLYKAKLGISKFQNEGSHRPQATFIFCGPTGVGKSEMASRLSEFLFGSKDYCCSIDCASLKGEFSVSKLFGAPPGYIGYDNGGILTNYVKEKPFSIIIFDEIEKADPAIFDSIIQLIDSGRIIDQTTNKTMFCDNLIILLTSNIGVEKLNQNINLDKEKVRDIIFSEVELYFRKNLERPEILNKIGLSNVMIFDPITKDIQPEIFSLKMKYLYSFLSQFNGKKKINISLEIAEKKVIEFLIEQNSDLLRLYNARFIEKLVSSEIESLLATNLIQIEIKNIKEAQIKFDVSEKRGIYAEIAN